MSLVTHVALIGLPGAGKSAVAPSLARRLGCAWLDLDREIERLEGRGVAAVFEEEGEERFRDLESLALAGALNGESAVVVACGGGVLGRPANRELLRSRARVVWLKVEPETAAERLRASGAIERPLLSGGPVEELLRSLLERRGRTYAEASCAAVETGGLTPEEIAERIAAALTRTGPRWDSSES